jgi:hypothetical protein
MRTAGFPAWPEKRHARAQGRTICAKEEIDRQERLLDDLSKIYPICSYCKKVREKTGKWISVEEYVLGISGTMASHGICPRCYEIELENNR